MDKTDTRYNWSLIQNEFLKLFINKYGQNQWEKISFLFAHKTPENCIKKWSKYTNPTFIKLKWTNQEDTKIIYFRVYYLYKLQAISFFLRKNKFRCLFRIKFIQVAKKSLLILKEKLKNFFLIEFSKINTNAKIIHKNTDFTKNKFIYINKYRKKLINNSLRFSTKVNTRTCAAYLFKKHHVIYDNSSILFFYNTVFNFNVYRYFFYISKSSQTKSGKPTQESIESKYRINLIKNNNRFKLNLTNNFCFISRIVNKKLHFRIKNF